VSEWAQRRATSTISKRSRGRTGKYLPAGIHVA
jgi:hypothetical protein